MRARAKFIVKGAAVVLLAATIVAGVRAAEPGNSRLIVGAMIIVGAAIATAVGRRTPKHQRRVGDAPLMSSSTRRAALGVVLGYSVAAVGLAVPAAMDELLVAIVVSAALLVAVASTVLLWASVWRE